MEHNAAFYDFTQQLQGTMLQAALRLTPRDPAAPAPPLLLQLRQGFAESPAWLLVQAAEFEPEPLSVERLRLRAIWSSEPIMTALLDLMVAEKWLDRRGADYYLLPAGDVLKHRLIGRPQQLIEPLETITGTLDLNRLEKLMKRVLDAMSDCPTPPGDWCLRYSRRRTPNGKAVARVFHYFSDFNAFRDDSHMAALLPHKVEGCVWEAFRCIGLGSAHDADTLFEQLAYRGFARADYLLALDDLVRRGWVVCGDHGCTMTNEGEAVVAEVERQTDQYFYAAWSCLSTAESDELDRMLEQLDAVLQSA
ncbi:MAG: hypothetical protein ABI835_16970 [Chloroflexota bacterium]